MGWQANAEAAALPAFCDAIVEAVAENVVVAE